MENNFAKVQGEIINKSIKVEDLINLILCKYFKPANKIIFLSIVLNSSVMSFGAKLKVLSAIGLEKKMFEKLLKISSIRNSFAHTNDTDDYTLLFRENVEHDSNSIKVLRVMNSQGHLKSKRIDQLHTEFNELFLEVELALQALYIQLP